MFGDSDLPIPRPGQGPDARAADAAGRGARSRPGPGMQGVEAAGAPLDSMPGPASFKAKLSGTVNPYSMAEVYGAPKGQWTTHPLGRASSAAYEINSGAGLNGEIVEVHPVAAGAWYWFRYTGRHDGSGSGPGQTCYDLAGPTLCLNWTSQGFKSQSSGPPFCYTTLSPWVQGPFTATLSYFPSAATGGYYLSDIIAGPTMFDLENEPPCGLTEIDTCIYVQFMVVCNVEGIQITRFYDADGQYPCGTPTTVCAGSWTYALPPTAVGGPSQFGATWDCNPTDSPDFVGFFTTATLTAGDCPGSGGGIADLSEFSSLPTTPNPFARAGR